VIAVFLLFAAWAQATGSSTGIVTDSVTHQPVRRVLVSAGGSRDLTNDDGTYVLHDLPPGEVKLKAALTGYRPVETTVQIAGGDLLKRDFELHQMARIAGKVFDSDTGQPVAPMVTLRNQARVAAVSSRSPKDGFEFSNLEPGDYTLDIDASEDVVISYDPLEKAKPITVYGGNPNPDTIHVVEGEQKVLDIRLPAQEAHSAGGTIEFPSGIDEARVRVGFEDGERSRIHEFPQRHPGSFRIDGLAAGMYRIYAERGEGFADRAYGSVKVNITDHDVEGLQIKLIPGVNITGTIRMLEDGASLPPKTPFANLIPSDPLSRAMAQPLFVEGSRFRGEGVAPGEYWPVFAALPDGYAVADVLFGNASTGGRPVTLNGPGELTIVVTSKPGMVVGTVRDANQRTVKGATLVLNPEVPGNPQTIRRTESGPGGEFQFRNLPPGKYTIEGAPAIDVRLGEAVNVTVVR
jgi:hypothetical protein